MNTINAELALDRIEWKFERLRVRLAAAEAERDSARAEVAALQEDADRARWCEETKAQVSWSIMGKAWRVLWDSDIYGYRQVSHPDRNAAIDAAKGGQ